MSGHRAAVSLGEKTIDRHFHGDGVQSESWGGGSKSGVQANQILELRFIVTAVFVRHPSQ